MDRSWISRLRWRRRGAWMWPLFGALTVADAILMHALPLRGSKVDLVPAALLAGILNLLAVAVVAPPLGALIRRLGVGAPRVVAHDFAGRALLLALSTAMLIIGIAHHSTVTRERRDLADATRRAQAYIGARAPAQFSRH